MTVPENKMPIDVMLRDPAFPHKHTLLDPVSGECVTVSYPGLTRRDYFAAAALQGLLSGIRADMLSEDDQRLLASHAFGIADKMTKLAKR
jgi:hypothetical protein